MNGQSAVNQRCFAGVVAIVSACATISPVVGPAADTCAVRAAGSGSSVTGRWRVCASTYTEGPASALADLKTQLEEED
jgi:hypothetical protein